MGNKEALRSVANVALRLLLICLAVAALVALVYVITEQPIAQGERARKEDAIRTIFADATEFEESNDTLGEGVNAVYIVKNSAHEIIGLCVDYTGVSLYGGDVNMMIGVTPDGKVNGVQIISHAETFIDRYTDENGCYTGIGAEYGTDLSAGATMSYNAIRNAIEAVERMFAPDGNQAASDAAEHETALSFGMDDVSLFFAGAVDFSEQESLSHAQIQGARLIRGENGVLLGRCVQYTAAGGHNGDMTLLMALSPTGEVIGVRVLQHYMESVDSYLDDRQCFDPEQGVVAGATVTYNAIRNAIRDVEALQIGGAV